jgi:2-oxo-4-hydroxy-4-carboxy-5-ureidoimidazoline decarboxylase
MRPDELITRIRLPRRRERWQQFIRKVGTRKAQAISKVCIAAAADMDGYRVRDIRIALGSVAPTAIRCIRTEDTLRGRRLDEPAISAAKGAIASEIAPISDIRSTSDYRSRVTVNLLEQFLRIEQFRICCGSEKWAAAMTERYPFGSQQQLLQKADEVWWSLTESDWLEAFASHPRIGEKPQHNSTAAHEQRGITGASAEILEALASGNQAYFDRFGYIYIVCASGRSSEEMLRILQSRLSNEPADELAIAAAEQAKITRLRLQELFP